MGLRFVCPSTAHNLETALEADEKLLLLRTNDLRTPCSFCGGSHQWVFVQVSTARTSESKKEVGMKQCRQSTPPASLVINRLH